MSYELSLIVLAVASLWAGAQNALAGGGSFVTFPALLLMGLDPRAANVTSTVALVPGQLVAGWAGRGMASGPGRLGLRWLVGISLVGGALGAGLLLVTPASVFARMVPWLVLFATALFAWGSFRRKPDAAAEPMGPLATGLAQFATAIYGGYFGGGMGFVMLAVLTMAGLAVRAAGATKNVLASVINLAALLVFVFSPDVAWVPAAVTCVAAMLGGLVGTWMLSRVNERALRAGIVLIGVLLTIGLFARGLAGMLFNSQAFILLFLPCVLAASYLAARWRTLRLLVLVAASLGFYGFWDLRFVPALAGLTLLNWLVVRAYDRVRRPWVLDAGVVLNLAVLGVCKYANFFAGTAAELLGQPFQPWAIILPLGVSFFTFQKISYLVDLRRGARPIYGLLEFAAFVTFFPQLIAGPLVRHDEIVHQFKSDPRGPAMAENLARGLALFTIGLAKKAALADTVALVCDPLYARAAMGPLTLAEAWAAAGTYALQIYLDFSGYSDMAIGLGLMFGLRLPFNFAAPYRAASIREFWRRWHMTLSRFLRDYVYIPLGGNRGGAWRQAGNVVLTMLLGGLWHGANWTFVAWGGLHGLALAANSAWDRAGLRMPRALGWALTLLFVVLCWVPFRAPDFATAWRVLEGLAGVNGIGRVKVDNAVVVAIAAGVALLGPTSQDAALRLLRPTPRVIRWGAPVLGAALAFLLLLVGGRVPNEFIYFQF